MVEESGMKLKLKFIAGVYQEDLTAADPQKRERMDAQG